MNQTARAFCPFFVSLMLALAAPAHAVGLAAGTTIQLAAQAEYLNTLAVLQLAEAGIVTLTVDQVVGVTIEQGQASDVCAPGRSYYFPMRVANFGNGLDEFSLTASSLTGCQVVFIFDPNDDGIHQDSEQWETPTTGGVVADSYCPCFAKVTTPSGLLLGGAITISAISTFAPSVGASASVMLTPPPLPAVAITSPTRAVTYETHISVLNASGIAYGGLAISSVAWSNDAGGSGICAGTSSWSCSGIRLQPGQNVIMVTASDLAGRQTTDTLTITCDVGQGPPSAGPPQVTITSPTMDGACLRNAATVRVAGMVDGGIDSVAWYNSATGQYGPCELAGSDWSVAEMQLAQSDNEIIIEGHNPEGACAAATVNVTYCVASPGDAWRGLAMVSLPLAPDETDPKPVVGFDSTGWLCFIPSTYSYAMYPDPCTFLLPAQSTPGRGFWAYFPLNGGGSAHPIGTFPRQDRPAAIHLQRGWNLIGQPFISEVVWDVAAIQVTQPTGSLTSLADSDAVAHFAWGWQQGERRTGGYYMVCDSTQTPGAQNKLKPWRAYWIKAKEDCDLIFPPP